MPIVLFWHYCRSCWRPLGFELDGVSVRFEETLNSGQWKQLCDLSTDEMVRELRPGSEDGIEYSPADFAAQLSRNERNQMLFSVFCGDFLHIQLPRPPPYSNAHCLNRGPLWQIPSNTCVPPTNQRVSCNRTQISSHLICEGLGSPASPTASMVSQISARCVHLGEANPSLGLLSKVPNAIRL
jgi:hypothetical protein